MVVGTPAPINKNRRLNPIVSNILPKKLKETPPDTIIYPLDNQNEYPFNGINQENDLYLNNPSNIKTEIVYDPITNEYIFYQKIGDLYYRFPNTMSFEEYKNYDLSQSTKKYWEDRANSSSTGNRQGFLPKLNIQSELFNRIFGGSAIEIRPTGSAELIFGLISNRRDDPSIDIRQRKTTNFDFQEKIQLSAVAKIGDKISFNVNYNTEATFDFENKLKLKYDAKDHKGGEDDIIQLIEAGDVSLPLNSTLIQGNQSLFGFKTKLQFGRIAITSVFSEQKSESKNITVSGGAQTNSFKITSDDYEENRHFFLAQYFYDNYEKSLAKLPIITSNINITKIEVWRTNIGAATQENRNVVAFYDLGENKPYNTHVIRTPGRISPTNSSNSLYQKLIDDAYTLRNINNVNNYLSQAGFVAGLDYEKVELARKLSPSEYTYNSKLGFISLNNTLSSDQVLAVAFQYTIIGDTTIYQVGEFSSEGINPPNALFLKLLKSTSINTHIPMYDLMMKNVYSIGGYQINQQDFRLNILFLGENNGIPTGYFLEGPNKGIPLIKLMNLDRVDYNLSPYPDGVFDFIDNASTQGGTMQASTGRIYFPVLQPFGKTIHEIFESDSILGKKYAYDSLYTLTKKGAQQYPDKNKFIIEGFYKSQGGSEISLNALNVPRGSVKVTAGGIPLAENVDYTVDYTLGRVKIINEGILNSGTPINISLENNSMFNIQTKTLMGTHIDYMINKDFNIGATILNLHEKPLTQKVNYGDEPISNTVWGLNLDYQTDLPFLTKLIDMLPLISTKAPSKIAFSGEFAQLIPGHSSAIGSGGVTYIDDFEGTKSSIDLKSIGAWFLASTPQGQTDLFPETSFGNDLKYGFNRSKFAWYVIDPNFYASNRPSNISKADISQPYSRPVLETEVTDKEPPNGIATNMAIMNLSFYPSERGPYNYDVNGVPGISEGLNADGTLKNDNGNRWGGIMRKIEQTDFEAANVEYIEFWMMDPFIDNPTHGGGQLYFNLGDISEDILKDGRKAFEHGLPISDNIINVDTTIWGRVPKFQAMVNTFDNTDGSRQFQDVGYDGLRDVDERSFFQEKYIQKIISTFGSGSQAYTNANDDPSSDNYHYFEGNDFDGSDVKVLERYKRYNGPEGNSLTPGELQSTMPNVEDINADNTLSEQERYYQYQVNLRPDKMIVGENYIADIRNAQNIRFPDGTTHDVKWYQFKIPIKEPERVVGGLQDFQSIRFIRMFLKGFTEPVICRMATFDLVRSEWRKFNKSLLSTGEYVPGDDQSQTSFNISAVNVEENASRTPIPYVLPPGINREINQGTTNLVKMNEQSLVLKVANLVDGDARAVYKTTEFDFRQFKMLRMFAHAEKLFSNEEVNDGEMTIFVRLGSDFTENFYEYEIPLKFTPWYTSREADNLIWPTENELNINLDQLVKVKQDRNTQLREGGSSISINSPYTQTIDNQRITVVGTPNISDVRTIMIGVRNPKKRTINDDDDMLAKSAEIWVNELRLTDFREESGWATTARTSVQLADLGNLLVSGSYSTPGFGSIEKKVNERQKEYISAFDIATNIELGKFFPQKIGLRIPMHIDYSRNASTPQYNPLNPDSELKSDLETYKTTAERDSIKALTQDLTTRTNINFINVRKERTGDKKKIRIYDIENLDFSYAYSNIFHRNVDIEYDIKQTHRGGIGYNFTSNPKNIKPFSKFRFLGKSKYLALIKDFNFYYLPKALSFHTDIYREYNESKMRNKSIGLILIEPTFVKKFEWNRLYTLRYDLAQSLKLEYSATVNSMIDEPQGRIDTKSKKDSIWNSVFELGRMTNYQQNTNITYAIPINKIPILNWITSNATYRADYRWQAAPLAMAQLGNSIENARTISLSGNVTMLTLYNKIGYLKKLNTEAQQNNKQSNIMNPRLQPEKNKKDTSQTKPKINILKWMFDNTLKLMMSLKNASVSYSMSDGIVLPGFSSTPQLLGQNLGNGSPGWGFVFGSQKDIRPDAAANGWLSTDTLLNSAYLTKMTRTLDIRATLEPIKDLKIELTANRNYSENYQEYYKADNTGQFHSYSPQKTGAFSISFFSIGTAFTGVDKNNYSELFQNFKDYRLQIANRLAQENPYWDQTYTYDTATATNFPTGYGSTSQNVLIPAFIAAYSGSNPSNVSLYPMPKIPIPGWRITYNGLTKIPFINKYIKTFTLSHAYKSTYTIGGYTTSIHYNPDDDFYQQYQDASKNFIPKNEIAQVVISEQFAPFFKMELTWANSLLSNFEYRKSRTLSLSFSNNQITEVFSNEYIIGLGYRIKDVTLRISSGRGSSSKKTFKSDINIKVDFSIRDNKTILRRINENIDQVSAGMKVYTINAYIDYMLSEKITFKLFFDKIINEPYVASQFNNSTTNAGISLKFTLAQ